MTEIVSRYGNEGPIAFENAASEIAANDIPKVVGDLRDTFNSEVTRPKAWRVKQLKQFLKMFEEGEQELCEAMHADLHKSYLEGYIAEISLIKSEIHCALKNLDKWMKPKRYGTTGLNFPGWSSTIREPLGVALVMGAWNYPVQLTLAPVVGALAAGNLVVIKPGSYAVETSHAIARLVAKYMDPRYVVCVEGNREMTNALLDVKFDHIFFTGSGFVGKIIARKAAEFLTPVTLELGGKSPCIVDKSANLSHAAKRLVWGAFLNAGQTCVRPDFLLVHKDVAEKFYNEMEKAVKKFYGTNAQESEFYGRIINQKAFTRLAGLIEASKPFIRFGGGTSKADKYVEPTLFDFGTDMEAFKNSSVMEDEIFGPLIPSFQFSNIEEALTYIRHLHTGKPLACYCMATDKKFIENVKMRTTSGALVINDVILHLVNHDIPFGGVGESGMGSYHGEHSFNAFSHEKAILEKSPTIDEMFPFKNLLNARFPPYTKSKMKIMKKFATPSMDSIVKRVPFLS